MRSSLLLRLLEEGYALTGRESQAAVSLTISEQEAFPPGCDLGTRPFDDCSPAGWAVQARGATAVRFVVAADADPAVTELEVYHRAIDALEASEPRTADERRDPTFGIYYSPFLSDAEVVDAEQEVLAGALLAGGTIVSLGHRSDYVMCVISTQPGYALARRPDGEPCPARVAIAPTTSRPRVRAGQLVSEVLPRESTRPRTPTYAEPKRKKWSDPVWPDARAMLRGGVAAGVVVRGQAADPSFTASALWGRERGFSLGLDLQMWPSAARPRLQVIETVPAVGVRLRAVEEDRVALDMGALAGLLFHSWRFDAQDSAFDESGTGWIVDGSLEFAVGPTLELWRDHELVVLGRAGWTGVPRAHTDAFEQLWLRTGWRLSLTAGINFGRELRRVWGGR